MELYKPTRTTFLNIISLVFLLYSAAFLSACNGGKTLSTVEQAQQIRLAINTNDAEKIRALSTLPLTIRNQEWVSAKDGSGFVLGSVKHTVVSTDDLFNKTISLFLKSLKIEGEQVITDITLNMFTSELGKSMNDWADLNIILFKRGEGDVEHIVLMGLNKKTNMLKAIYIN